jgi:hypothetical protein
VVTDTRTDAELVAALTRPCECASRGREGHYAGCHNATLVELSRRWQEAQKPLDEKWMRDSFHHLRKAVGVFLRPASDGTADWVLVELRKLERQFAAAEAALTASREEVARLREAATNYRNSIATVKRGLWIEQDALDAVLTAARTAVEGEGHE